MVDDKVVAPLNDKLVDKLKSNFKQHVLFGNLLE